MVSRSRDTALTQVSLEFFSSDLLVSMPIVLAAGTTDKI